MCLQKENGHGAPRKPIWAENPGAGALRMVSPTPARLGAQSPQTHCSRINYLKANKASSLTGQNHTDCLRKVDFGGVSQRWWFLLASRLEPFHSVFASLGSHCFSQSNVSCECSFSKCPYLEKRTPLTETILGFSVEV